MDGQKGFPGASDALAAAFMLDPSLVAHNFQKLCEHLSSVFSDAAQRLGAFEVDQIELAVEITGKGEVRLLGSVSAEAKGGVKLVLKRRK